MSRTSGGRRALRLVLASALVAAAALSSVVVPGTAFAEGSRDFYPASATCSSTGSCRANIEWRNNSYGPAGSSILRRTLFTVFATQGEVLEMGSSAVGVGSGDIVVWNPGRVTDDQAVTLPSVTSGTDGFKCSDQRAEAGAPASAGMITSRAQEQAGPQSVTGGLNPTGYVPCHYSVPATGLYKVAFYGPAGADSNANGTPTGDLNLASTGNFDTTQGTSIAAWDLTVRADDTSITDITGRVFTYALAAFTGANSRPIDQTLYATTLDGYEYKVDTDGLDPNGFLIYGNEQGYLDPEGNPLNHDVVFTDNTMTAVKGGVKLAPPTYPISFSKLSQDTLNALHIDDTPAPPSLTSLAFDGANTGSSTYVGRGGTFTFDVQTHGTYNLVISRDGSDFDPATPTNRVLRGVVDPGSRSVTWDGLDNAGNPFPAGNDYAVRAEVRGGVYHFPLLDAENSTKGGPSFKLLNPPGGSCPFGNASCTTSFYDDRGYHTSVADVGTPGQVLSGTNPPATDHSDPFTGYDSTTNQRAWGATGNGFGDTKGLDSWTYFPSTTRTASLNVLAVPAAPAASDDAGTVQVGHDLSVTTADGVLANDAGTSLRVTDHTDPAHGTLSIDPDGSYTYTPAAGFSGHDSFGYTASDPAAQTASATVQLTVSPEATDDSGTTQTDRALDVDAAHGVLANDHGSGLSVTDHTPPAHGTLSIEGTGAYTYTPDAGWSGRDSFGYTATDDAGQHVTATVDVSVTPTAADHTGETTAETALDVPAADGLLTDSAGSGLTVTGSTQPAHGSVTANADGSYQYTPATNYSGPDSFDYTVTDAAGQPVTATVHLTVLPTAGNDEQTTPEGQELDVTPTAGLLLNDRGSSLTVTDATAPAHGTVTTQPNGSFSYSPEDGWSGSDSFDYTVTDATGQTATATVVVKVTPRAPDDHGSTQVNTELQVDAAHGVLVNDFGTRLTVADHTEPAHGVLDLNADGSYTYQPDTDWSGSDSFTYTATDGDGGRSNTATVTLSVVPTAANYEQTTTVGVEITVTPEAGVLSGDRGRALTLVENTDPAHGTLTMRTDGGYTYSPATGWSGEDSFDYTVKDAEGQLVTGTVTVHVRPVAHDDTAHTTVGHAVTLHSLTNDLGTGLRVTSVSSVSRLLPAFVGRGTVEVQGDSVVYTPARGVSGLFTFTYTVHDAANQQTQAVATVSVAPRAVDDSDWTPIDTPVVIQPLTDDLGSFVHLDSVTEPAHGTVVPVGDLAVFAPERGFVGTTSFSYTLRDGAGQLSTARVSVRVKPSDAQVRPDELSTDPGKALTFDPTVNDPGRSSFDHTTLYLGDPTGERLVRNLVTPAGTFTVAPHTGRVTFDPAKGFVGRIWNVGYVVADNAGRLHRSTIMVHIGDQAGAPGRSVTGDGLKPGRDVVAGTGTVSTGLKPGRVITGELAATGNPVGPVLPLAGAALVGLGFALVRRRPSR